MIRSVTFVLISFNLLRFCLDMDECTQISGICGNGTCVNTAGSFRCNCHSGFRLDRRGYCQGEQVKKKKALWKLNETTAVFLTTVLLLNEKRFLYRLLYSQ